MISFFFYRYYYFPLIISIIHIFFKDDVMHVIVKIRVPLLRVKSDYQLMGKVGQELVRGRGQFNGNFCKYIHWSIDTIDWLNIPSFFFWNNTLSWFAADVVGDFTIELKKTKGQDELMVRAARNKLNATKKNVSLQGMDEEGPVKSILSNGKL